MASIGNDGNGRKRNLFVAQDGSRKTKEELTVNARMMAGIVAVALLLIAGCAGHEPNPIASHQIGDDNRTSTSLQLEIAQNEALAIKKTKTAETKVWTNIFWFLVFTPIMDVKDSENTEAQALRARNDYLRILISEKESNQALTSRPSVR